MCEARTQLVGFVDFYWNENVMRPEGKKSP